MSAYQVHVGSIFQINSFTWSCLLKVQLLVVEMAHIIILEPRYKEVGYNKTLLHMYLGKFCISLLLP